MLTNKAHLFDFENLVAHYGPNLHRGSEEVSKQIRKIFDKSDLRPDEDRDDLFIYNNRKLMRDYPALNQIT